MNLRCQTSASGIAQNGSSQLFGLDPLRLPVSFTAADPSADGGTREISISSEGVEFRRSVRGVEMRVKLPFAEFEGLAVRVLAVGGGEPVIFLALEHRDDALSVLLLACEDSDEMAAYARRWHHATGRPILVAGSDGKLHNPATMRIRAKHNPRRRRHSALRNRRSIVRFRSLRTNRLIYTEIYSDEREIIARD